MEQCRGNKQAVERVSRPGEGHGKRYQSVQGVARHRHSEIRGQRSQNLVRLYFELADLLEELQLQPNHGRDEQGRVLKDFTSLGTEDLSSTFPEENSGVSV